ncbi:MAG: hypothetical protein V1799_22025 [bacterium]
MKIFFFGLFLTLTAFGQHSHEQKQLKQNIDVDRYTGIYEYVYRYNSPGLKENHYIVLSRSSNTLAGLYYGTSDEFDESREGYLPGFFVAQMDSLKIHGDTIRFTLKVANSDFLTTAVDLNIKSTTEALKAGYKNWGNKIPTSPKKYAGLIQDSVTIFFKGEKEFLNKTFKKKQ